MAQKHHKVHHREIDLYLSLLRDKERTISWKEWLRRVEDRYSDYRAAEWIAAGEKEPFLLWKRIANVSVGIRFESVAGIELHETRKNDPVFRANVSDTGFRSLSFRGPAVKLETSSWSGWASTARSRPKRRAAGSGETAECGR